MDQVIKNTLGLLFVASEPLSRKQLAELTETDEATIDQAIKAIGKHLQNTGLQIITHHHQYELATSPEVAQITAKYLGAQPVSLSAPALETLAIIAYKQPVSKEAIDEIRGIASDQTLRNLLSRGLISQKKTKNGPINYVTTAQFLAQSGLETLEQLPAMEADNGN